MEGVTGVLRESRVFPEAMVEMAHTGESSGNLDNMLLRIASSLEEEATHAINIMMVVVPVIIYLAVAFYIASIIIGFYTGYFRQLSL